MALASGVGWVGDHRLGRVPRCAFVVAHPLPDIRPAFQQPDVGRCDGDAVVKFLQRLFPRAAAQGDPGSDQSEFGRMSGLSARAAARIGLRRSEAPCLRKVPTARLRSASALAVT